MSSGRRFGLGLALVASLLAASCGAPPDKEMQQAQGALDAARAAGASEYAREEFAAAQDALVRSQDAVAQRDYRLALNHALDSRERAQNAAREAADRKAIAHGDADRALSEVSTLLAEAVEKLKAAETARVPARLLAAPRLAITDGDRALQEARATFSRGSYLAVPDLVAAHAARLRAVARDLDAAATQPARRRR